MTKHRQQNGTGLQRIATLLHLLISNGTRFEDVQDNTGPGPPLPPTTISKKSKEEAAKEYTTWKQGLKPGTILLYTDESKDDTGFCDAG